MPTNPPRSSRNALRAFEATTRLGSMGAAAAELFVTHGAVSRHIRSLEGQMGVVLADAGRRPRPDGAAEAADARRAVARPGADHRAAAIRCHSRHPAVRHDHPAGGAERAHGFRWRTAAICWRPAASPSKAVLPNSSTTRTCAPPTSAAPSRMPRTDSTDAARWANCVVAPVASGSGRSASTTG